MAEWLVRQPGSEPVGPVSTDLVIRGIQAGRVAATAMVCRVGTQDWLPIAAVAELAGYLFDDESATNVTDSPWFLAQERMRKAQVMPAVAGPAGTRPSLGLPPPPSHRMPPPAPNRAGAHAVGQRSYGEVDDDAETRVASPPSEAAGFSVDDETMTRVASPNVQAPAARRGGVLPTLPMRETADPMQETRADVPAPKPRPAAGAPAPPSAHGDVLPPTQPFVQVGSFPPVPGPGQPPAYDPNAYYSAPPGQLPPHPYTPYPQAPQDSGDQGLRALVGLIIFLAVALAIVLILLVIRR
ncbi:MAG: DUF4339 domain-containing protein [Polyangiaceae bacterium]